MAVHIRMGNSEAILKLYERYLEVLKRGEVWEEKASVQGSELHGDDLTYDALASTALPPGHVRHSPGEVSILLAATTAHAMQDSFENALQASLGTGIRFQHYIVKAFLRNVDHDPVLQQKVGAYVRCLEIARLMAHPSFLSLHVSNLGKDKAVQKLERLYCEIMDGLSGPRPYIAPNPTTVDSKRPVFMPELVWKSFLAAFLASSRKDLAEKLWDDMLKLGIRPGVSVWTALFDGYDNMGAVDEMLNGWDGMISQDVQPDGLAYRALISTLFNGNRPLEATQRFKTFQKESSQLPSLEPSHVLSLYNTMLHGLLISAQEKEAITLFESMKQNGPKPDIVSYNTLLGYYGRRGDFKAQSLVIQNLTADGLAGDVFTFSTILSALLKIGREDAPQMMIGLMQKQGIRPNTATYSAIIDRQLREQNSKNFEAALGILNTMEQDPYSQPNEITYTTILAGIYRGGWLEPAIAEEYRQNILQRMKKRDIQFNKTTYHILLKACLEYPEPKGLENALGYYREMVLRQIPMGRDTWYLLLNGLIRRGEWTTANEMVETLMRSKVQPPAGIMGLVNKIRRRMAEKMKSGPEAFF
jgi:pentatricopeptide repeat protein